MSGFTKLVPTIVQSSIWNESSDVRIIWITMLAVKDENGYVQGDERTLARLANVSTEAAKEALDLFQRPDEGSKTTDNDGKRICKAPGGWIVLNHDAYRAHDDIKRAQTRERVKRFRDKQSDVTRYGNVTETLPSASASVSEEEKGMQGEEKTPTKTAFGEFKGVKLSDEEHAKLTKKHGAARLAKGIEILDDYMRSKGKRYKDHYAVLKETSWVWTRLDESCSGTADNRATARAADESNQSHRKQLIDALAELIREGEAFPGATDRCRRELRKGFGQNAVAEAERQAQKKGTQ